MFNVGELVSFNDDYFKTMLKNPGYSGVSGSKIVKVHSVFEEEGKCYLTVVTSPNRKTVKDYANHSLVHWTLRSIHFRPITEEELKEYTLKKIFIK